MAAILQLLGLLCIIRGTLSTACSSADLKNDVTSCLNQMKARLTDVDAFFFGTDFPKLCPRGPYSGPGYCLSGGAGGDSISTKVFPSGPGMNLTELDTYLEMMFTVEPGNYTGCGNTFINDQQWIKRIDPTEGYVVYPWYTRHLPALSWDTTPGELYSLIVYDVGVSITHGIYLNIQNNNIEASDKIDPYHGPLNTMDVLNPYIFMVFRQPGRITLSQEWIAKIESTEMFAYTIESFVIENGLIGPVAVNWMDVQPDAYAAQEMLDKKILANCPMFVSKELNKMSLPFLPQPVMLSVWVDVHFKPDTIMFFVCCRTQAYVARNISTNPLGNTVVPTGEVRSAVVPSFAFRKQGLYTTSTDFTGDMYTLLMVDPDVPFPQVGTQERPLVHQMIVNIANGNTSTGQVVQTYMGPAPPDDKKHHYYFLLYKQQQTVNAAAMPQYAGNSCSARLAGRCLYNITEMVQDNNLTLVGASWMVAEKDDYVIYNNIQSNPDDAPQQCQGQPGYSNPCVTDAATRMSRGSLVMLAMLLLSLL